MSKTTRTLLWLLAVTFVVSVVHYVDNYVNYAEYPQPGPGDDLPAPSAGLVAASWFVFTASGAAGLWLWFRGRITIACVALTGYSLSGLVGIGHYLVPGATEMVWWRQTHVLVDIACGLAVFGFAVWAVLRLPGRITAEGT
ncbi:hypothetical protein [Amycolatopsis palatopharyngis]|uniref:hypothetical protein n=1 Tax=Amycolatopsis palatopharyngis TaxID=187982 RepID=UPI000E273CA4|nr:hypothetical protein [Amycolatopsis palatopharyngis]